AVVVWPIVALYAIARFQGPLKAFLSRGNSMTMEMFGTKVTISGDAASKVLQNMADEVDNLVNSLEPTMRMDFDKIMTSDGAVVGTLLPGYERGARDDPSRELKTLRELRHRALVRPREGGQWKPEKHLEVTPFGKLVVKLQEDSKTRAAT
ncbi:MAG TPA: hypothetical protein VN224_03765, partial [Xanthomonadales bacterium]|nr:hypothetical protein [Xanthomonadales bacterium]